MLVTDITPQKNNGQRYNLFIDGEFYCGLNDETTVAFGLRKGVELTREKLKTIVFEDNYSSALARGLEYAARTSGKSGRDFRDKLDKFPQDVVDKVIVRLEELGYIDDNALADDIVSRSLEKGEGVLMIRQRLKQKRISSAIVERACDIDYGELLRSAEKCRDQAVSKYGCNDPKERAKVYAAMQRRGFTSDIISDVLDTEYD